MPSTVRLSQRVGCLSVAGAFTNQLNNKENQFFNICNGIGVYARPPRPSPPGEGESFAVSLKNLRRDLSDGGPQNQKKPKAISSPG
jgi:hypothetical protein